MVQYFSDVFCPIKNLEEKMKLTSTQIEEILKTINNYIKELIMERKTSISIRKDDKVHSDYWETTKYYFLYTKHLNKSMRNIGVYEITEEEENIIKEGVKLIDDEIKKYQKRNPHQYKKFLENFTGLEYEIYCMDLLNSYGWDCKLTKGGGDFGADIIAKKDETKAVIQCKRHKSRVGVSAVKDIFVGNAYYKGSMAIVCSNMDYSKPARDLARALNVQLIHHHQLSDILDLS